MRLIKLLAAVAAGAATLVLTLVLPGRRPGRLRLDRARAALRLAARGGVRYVASAPRLFVAAGEQRQLLREDLALQTAEDVAGTLWERPRPRGRLTARRPRHDGPSRPTSRIATAGGRQLAGGPGPIACVVRRPGRRW
jgi:hypothetical protein